MPLSTYAQRPININYLLASDHVDLQNIRHLKQQLFIYGLFQPTGFKQRAFFQLS